MMRPPEGTIVFRRGSDVRGSYTAVRDVVRIFTDGGGLEVPWSDGDWELTKDRPLVPMQVAELKWGALAAYRRMMGRQQPDWSMMRDGQRIQFASQGDAMTDAEMALVAAIDGVFQ